MYQSVAVELVEGVSTMSEVQPEAPSERARSLWETSATLFERWRTGDQDALDELVRLLSPVLWQVVRATGVDRGAAEDVVQTTWLTLVRSGHTVEQPRAVAGWLCTAARREAWRVARRTSRQTPTEDGAIARALPDESAPEDEVVLDAAHRQLWDCLRRLPERCQRLLRIVAAESRPDYSVVSAQLDMPIGSIGPTRGRCLAKLRSELDREGWQR